MATSAWTPARAVVISRTVVDVDVGLLFTCSSVSAARMSGVAARSVLQVTRATMATDGPGMLSKKTWAVVGNHGKNPVVDQLTERLSSNGKTVYRVNPYGKPPAEYKSLADIPDPSSVDCVDLVVNPTMGMDIVDECERLGIANVFVQPGAGTPELVARAESKGLGIHQGCVLVELPPAPSSGL